MKDFSEEEYELVRIIPMDNKPEFGIALCRTKEGKLFKATPKMNHSERRQLLADKSKYTHSVATVSFFGKTEEGLPRFPVLKTITVAGDLEDFRKAS